MQRSTLSLPPPPAVTAASLRRGVPTDFSHVKHEQREAWYRQLVDAYERLTKRHRHAGQPIPAARLAEETGLPDRVVRALLQERGWALDLRVAPPHRGAQPTPDEIRALYVTVEEARHLLGTSKSHIYVALRALGTGVRTTSLAGMRFILREDLPKLAPVRAPHRAAKARKATPTTTPTAGNGRAEGAP